MGQIAAVEAKNAKKKKLKLKKKKKGKGNYKIFTYYVRSTASSGTERLVCIVDILLECISAQIQAKESK